MSTQGDLRAAVKMGCLH